MQKISPSARKLEILAVCPRPHFDRPETLRNVDPPTFPQSMIKFEYFLVGNHCRIWFWIWGKEFWPIRKLLVFWSFLPFFWRYGSKNAPLLHFWCWFFIFLHYDTDFWNKKLDFYVKVQFGQFGPDLANLAQIWPNLAIFGQNLAKIWLGLVSYCFFLIGQP